MLISNSWGEKRERGNGTDRQFKQPVFTFGVFRRTRGRGCGCCFDEDLDMDGAGEAAETVEEGGERGAVAVIVRCLTVGCIRRIYSQVQL